jgi:hypothetical protein
LKTSRDNGLELRGVIAEGVLDERLSELACAAWTSNDTETSLASRTTLSTFLLEK